MIPSRLLPPIIAVVTLVVLFANALPCSVRKHRLNAEARRLRMELRQEQERETRLHAEIFALEHDPFYIERICIETWHLSPRGVQQAPWTLPLPSPHETVVYADE